MTSAALAVLTVLGLLQPIEAVSSPADPVQSDRPPAGLSWEVNLKARRFTPDPVTDIDAIRAGRVGGSTDDVHYLLQLERIPTAAEREALGASGVAVLSYVSGTTYVASTATKDLEQLLGLSGIRAATPILPADKLEAGLGSNEVPSFARQGRDNAVVEVQFHPDVSVDDGRNVVRSVSGRVLTTLESINTITALVPTARIAELVRRDEVAYVSAGRPPLEPAVGLAKQRANADMLASAPYSLDGSGVTVMVFDSGTAHPHPDYESRIVQRDDADAHDHATHVTGIIAGDGTAGGFAGVAPKVKIRSFGEDGSAVGMLTDAGDLEENVQAALAAGGMEIVNMSLAANANTNPLILCSELGDYRSSSAVVDNVVRGAVGAPLIFVEAVGNERGGGDGVACPGYNTVSPPATAKNSIAVGSFTTSTSVVSSYSSLGPTDDGRIKPDLIAPGCHFEQSMPPGDISSTGPANNYVGKCGTSMATPLVSGVAALLVQQWRGVHPAETPANHTVKAVLVHTAKRSVPTSAPTYSAGYGLIDAKDAVDVVRDSSRARVVVGSIANSVVQTYRFYSDGTAPPKVTLAWDDPAAASGSASTLVNDLDVRLIAPGETARQAPWRLDPAQPGSAATRGNNVRDNLEVVEGEQAKAGEWTVRVVGTRVADGPQGYTLVTPPNLGLTVADATKAEGNTGTTDLSFSVGLSSVHTKDVSVSYTTEGATATEGTDYTGASGTVVIPAGQRSASFVVTATGDTEEEQTETFRVRLSSPTEAYLERSLAHGYILDDDQPRQYDVIAVAGNGGDTADSGVVPPPALGTLGLGPSINDKGSVAFTGFWGSFEGVFRGTKARTFTHLTKGFTSTSRDWGESVQINDHEVVVARDRTTGSPIPNRIRVFDGNGAPGCAGAATPCWSSVAAGGTPEVGKSRADFDSVDPLPTISDAVTSYNQTDEDTGQLDFRNGIAFKAQRGTAFGIVATPGLQTAGSSPNPFSEITAENGAGTRPMIASTGEIAFRRVLPSWGSQHRVVVGDRVVPTSFKANGFMYEAVSVGFQDTTNTAEPTWPTTVGAEVLDRATTWRNVGRHPAKLTTPTVQEPEIVVREPGAAAGAVTVVAGPSNGFSALGRAPGISDDGRIVTFFGDLNPTAAAQLGTTSGPGVFAAVKIKDGTRKIVRVAGTSGNGQLDPGETYTDVDMNGRFDPSTETDEGPIKTYAAADVNERVVSNATQATLQSVGVAFLATDGAGARSFYVARLRFIGAADKPFDPDDPKRFEVKGIRTVVKVGDRIKDLGGRVTAIAIWDPINDRQEGDLAFHVRTSEDVEGGSPILREAIIRALAPKTPLLFIPGVAGSELYDLNTPVDGTIGQQVWLDYRPFYDAYLRNRLSLRPEDRAQYDIAARAILRKVRVFGDEPQELPDILPAAEARKLYIYDPLIKALEDAGYREYQVGLDQPEYRTTAGCNMAAQPDRPDLFTFPYDWRLDNGENADRVADFVGCIERLYPGSEINILTHSMGSLLGRRYVMENPVNPVHTMVTLAAPWLGATKLAYVLETGDFAAPLATGVGVKYAAASITAAHQLAPSRAFFELGGTPLGEDGRDEDQDGNDSETYSYQEYIDFENARYPEFTPGATAEQFHDHVENGIAQDDWRADPTGIVYHHVYAVQAAAGTIAQTNFAKKVNCSILAATAGVLDCRNEDVMDIIEGLGDGTVPEISASRTTMRANLNAPNATLHPFVGHDDSAEADFYFDHNGMTQNVDVQRKVLELLGREGPKARNAAAVTTVEDDEPVSTGSGTRKVSLFQIDGLRLADDLGHSTDDVIPGYPGSVPGATTYVLGDTSRKVVFDDEGRFTARFMTTDRPASVEVEVSDGASPTKSVVWRDLDLPAGRVGLLTLLADGSETLEWDSDGDGAADTDVVPTATALGDDASDDEGPTISYTTATVPSGIEVSLAADDPSTVTALRYSTDGTTYRNYDGPFVVDPDEVSAVTAIADDAVGNRSDILEIPIEILNRPPTADAFAVSTAEDGSGVATTLSGSDPDGDPITFEVIDGPDHGALTGTSPDLTYVPDADFNGTDTFTYRALDASANSDPVTVTITVTPVNDAPTAAADTTTVDEDGTVLVDVLANDATGPAGAGESGQVLSITAAGTPGDGTAVVETGKVRYTPDPDATGPDSFTYEVCDDGTTGAPPTPDPRCATGTVTVTRTPVNDAPVATGEGYVTAEDTALVVVAPGLLLNDTDVDGDGLVPLVVTGPSKGAVVVQNDGSFTYTPTANSNGADSFTYQVGDGVTTSAPATVAITVTPVADAPTADGDTYVVAEDGVLDIDGPGVLDGDTDADGDPLTAVIGTPPAHGTLTLDADGGFTYAPAANYAGADGFTYTATDGTLSSAPTSVAITVTPVGDVPVALADAATVAEDDALDVDGPGLLGNDTDADGDPLSAVLETAPTHGIVSVDADGGYQYTPAADFHGSDSFTYRASDGATSSAPATVTLTITPVADAPRATADAYAATEDVPLVQAAPGVLGNDADPDGDAVTAQLVSGPAHGTLALQPDGSFTYTPAADFHGPDSFTYRASDGSLVSAITTVSVTVAPADDVAAAVDDAYATPLDTALVVAAPGVLANDTDPDGDGLSATVVDGPDHGALVLGADGSFTFTPAAGFEGVDTFTYRARGAGVDDPGSVATVVLTIGDPNVAPIGLDDGFVVDEDAVLVVAAPGVLDNDTDGDGDALSAALDSGPAHGQLVLADGGGFTYTPAPDFHGSDSFTYRPGDGRASGAPTLVTITVQPKNDAPVAVGETATVAEDATLVVAAPGVLGNDADVDGDALLPVLGAVPAHGTVELANDGSFAYTPAPDFHGSDGFSYTVTDGSASSGTVLVAITVTPVNDAPVAIDDARTVAEDAVLTVAAPGVLANDTDVEGDTLSAAVVTGPVHGVLSLQPDGSLGYTPDHDFAGTDAFTYRVADGSAQSAPATVSITVTPVNDPPTATVDAHNGTEDTVLDIAVPGVLGNDADVDGDSLSAVLEAAPARGTLTLRPDGSFRYVPAADASGPEIFTYRVSDGTAQSAPVSVTLTVAPAPDAPVAGDDSYATAEDTALAVDPPGVLANDSDADGDALELEQLTAAGHGTVALQPSGGFVYTPANGYSGPDTFTYRTGDGGRWSPAATVAIAVGAVHDDPTAASDFAELPEDSTVVVDVLANDAPGDPGRLLSVASVTGAAHGAASVVAGGVRYQPGPNWHGVEQLQYSVCDDASTPGCATGSLQVVVVSVNDRPVSGADAFALDEDGELVVAAASGVLANDADDDGDTLVAAVTGAPSKGTVDLTPDGGFTYRPQPGVNGTDSFTYAAFDGTEAGQPVTVTITIRPVVDPPQAVADTATTAEDTPVLVDVLANDVAGDAGKALVVSSVGAPSSGAASIEGGRVRYAPAANWSGSDSVAYTLCQAGDGPAGCTNGSLAVTVTPVNDAPVAAPDSYQLDRKAALEVTAASGVLANDTDVDGPALTAALVSGPTHGTVVLQANGSFRYVPAAQYDGPDAFTYRAGDGSLASEVVTVAISVRAVNTRPTAVADSYATMQRNGIVRQAPGILANDVDAEGNRLTVVLLTDVRNGTLALHPDGAFTYLPNPDFAGVDRFQYLVTDGELSSDPVAVDLRVVAAPVPAAPPPEVQTGYWLAGGDGGVFSYGDAPFYGSTGDLRLNQPVVGIVATTSGNGYWLVASDGGIFSFGDAQFFGSTGSMKLNQPVVGMVPTPTGGGYWLVARDGGIFAFGDAGFFGSTGSMVLNQPVVGMVPTPSGDGYWMVARDGGIFAFGDAPFLGSTGDIVLNRPIVSMVARPTGKGYWMVATDGGIFAFGDALFRGSTGDRRISAPVISMAPTRSGDGYWIVGSDGAVYAFGDAGFYRGPDGQVTPIAGAVPNPNGTGLVLADERGSAFTFGSSEFTDGAPPLQLNAPMIGLALRPER